MGIIFSRVPFIAGLVLVLLICIIFQPVTAGTVGYQYAGGWGSYGMDTLAGPSGVGIDKDGNVYVADTYHDAD